MIRLNWFSPLPPAETDIAHYTADLLPALAARAQLTLWTEAKTWDPALEKFGAVRHYYPKIKNTELAGTLNVFHIANQRAFHLHIFRLAHEVPGLVVLHDLAIPNLIGGLPFSTRRAQPIGPADFDRALGLFVHARRALEIFRGQKIPAAYRPFPYAARDWPDSRDSDPVKRLILFGQLDVPGRLDVVLQALASHPRRDRFRLDIFGRVLKRRRIDRAIKQLALSESVTLHGYVAEAELDAALSRADLALNLRFPTMGEASSSQLRIWDHGLASLVTRGGWYADLPEGTVGYVDVENEIPQLHQHFDALLDDPEFYARLGQRGRAELLAAHTPDNYVDALIQLAEEVSS